MQVIRRYASGLLMLGLALVLPVVSAHAFVSKDKKVHTAVATLTGAGDVTMTLAIKKVSDDSADTQINWGSVGLPSNWMLADDYIQMDSVVTATGGGIQTYTDNMNASASPLFTGDKTQITPAGLIDATDTTAKLSMAWAIKDTLVSGGPTAAEPNEWATNTNSPQWHYYEDASQVAIASLNASAFVNGGPRVTILNTKGIHYAQADTEFGSAPSPNFLYFQADFGAAHSPATYQTNQLIVEAYAQ